MMDWIASIPRDGELILKGLAPRHAALAMAVVAVAVVLAFFVQVGGAHRLVKVASFAMRFMAAALMAGRGG